MTTLLYGLLGLTIGLVSGTMGIGGGVLLVPALIWLFGFEQSKATGTTLGVLAMPVGLLAAWKYYEKGHMDLEAAVCIAAAFVVGAYSGATLMPYLPVATMRLLFGLMLVYIGLRFLVDTDSNTANTAVGLIGVALAWVGYGLVRLLSHRHLPRPDLHHKILQAQERRHGEVDYHI